MSYHQTSEYLQRVLPTVFPVLRFFWRAYQRINSHLYSMLISINLPRRRFVKISHSSSLSFEILVDPKNGYHDKDIAFRKKFDTDFSKYFIDALPLGGTFIDIGANIGYFTLLCRAKVGNNGFVHAFEPIQAVAQQLTESLKKNNFTNVSVHQCALGEKAEQLSLHVVDDSTSVSTLVSTNQPVNESSHFETVDVETFDSIFSPTQKIDLIKIDVEGYELQVIKGMKEYLSKQKPVLIIEYSPTFYNHISETLRQELIKQIFSYGYTITLLDQGVEVPVKSANDILHGRYSTGVWNIVCR